MRTFTKIYWGIWSLGLLLVIFAEIATPVPPAMSGPGLGLFLYFGVTIVVALLYGIIVLTASFFGKK